MTSTRLLRLATLAAALTCAPAAAAQTSPTELARRALLDEAETARAAGDHTRALDLATRAAQLRVTPSLRLLLAQEHHALGHLLEALDQSSNCAREAAADASMNNRERILEACRALSTSLAPQVGYVVVRLASPPEGAAVRVAGSALNPALWGIDFPVVPGEVVVEAEAPGGARFRRTVTVAPGGRANVDVVLPVVAPRRVPVIPVEPVRSSRGAAPWVVLGVGAASLASSLVFVLLRNDALDSRDTECDASGRGRCNNRLLAEAYDSDYRAYSTLTNVTLGVGALGVTVGAIWLLATRGSSGAPGRATASLGLHPTADGAVFELGGSL